MNFLECFAESGWTYVDKEKVFFLLILLTSSEMWFELPSQIGIEVRVELNPSSIT